MDIKLSEILKEKKKLNIYEYQIGIQMRELDKKRNIDRSRIINNPNFKATEEFIAGYSLLENGGKTNGSKKNN